MYVNVLYNIVIITSFNFFFLFSSVPKKKNKVYSLIATYLVQTNNPILQWVFFFPPKYGKL